MNETIDPPTKPTVLVPPRPNLGPEPLEETTRPGGPGVAAIVGVIVALLVVAILVRRRPKRTAGLAETDAVGAGEAGELPSPRDRFILEARRVRAALVDRFGERWRAKTTEEIASDPELAGAFDAETSARLIAFLREADLAKFSGNGPAFQGDLTAWDGWLPGFFAAAGAKSTIKGK